MSRRAAPKWAFLTLCLAALVPMTGLSAVNVEPDAHSKSGLFLGTNSPVAISADERRDLGMVAEALKISFDEAVRRFAGQEQFARAVDAIRALEPSAFTSAVWEAGEAAGYSGTINFTHYPGADAIKILSELPVVVQVTTDKVLPESALLDLQAQAREVISKMPGVNAASASLDDDSGRVVVQYTSESKDDIRLEDVLRSIEHPHSEVDAKEVLLLERDEVLSSHETAIVGGGTLGGCTAAFTVSSGGVRGIATAAHCSNSTYTYGGVSAPFEAQSSPSSGDVQWNSVSGAAITNKFVRTTSGALQSVVSVSNPTTGSAICYWGKTTGSKCGTVTQINYCDSSGYCLLFRYGPSTVALGDSGGPWYFGSVAKGITRGYLTNSLGFRIDDIATRVGALNLINLLVKTSP